MGSLLYNALTDRAQFGTLASLEDLTEITILVWVYPTDWTTTGRVLTKDDGANGWQFSQNRAAGQNFWQLLHRRSGGTLQYRGAFGHAGDSTWQCAAMVHETSTPTVRFYHGNLSTRLALETNTTTTNSTGTFNSDAAVGVEVGNREGINQGFPGRIGLVMAWDRQLTLGELLSQQYRPHWSPGLVFLVMPGIDGSASSIKDFSGRAQHSTSTNGITIEAGLPVDLSGLFASGFDDEWSPPSGGQSVAIGIASETDSAQSITPSKSLAIGIASESDSGFAITAGHAAAIGIASETDSAQSLTPSKASALGLASETDSAQSIAASKSAAIGIASETDSGLSIGAGKSTAIGVTSETDSAQSVTPSKSLALGIAEETDSALSITGATEGGQTIAIGLATETDTAFSITPSKTRAIGIAEETDTALGISPMKSIGLGVALEMDEAFAMVAGKSRTIGLANELDTALAMTVSGGAPILVFGATKMTGIYVTRSRMQSLAARRAGMTGFSVTRSRMTDMSVEPEGT